VCCGGATCAGIDTLLDDMAAADPEWSKLVTVPGLLEPWNDVRDKWQVATDEFKVSPGALLAAAAGSGVLRRPRPASGGLGQRI
jgi:hypothetical protein